MFDPFGRRRIAQLQADNTKLQLRVTRLEGCKVTLTQLNERRVADLNQAHVYLSNGSAAHRALRQTLAEQLAIGVVEGLAGGWAYKVADELAVQAGVDLRPDIQRRINEMTGQTRLPGRHAADNGQSSERTDAPGEQPAKDAAEVSQ